MRPTLLMTALVLLAAVAVATAGVPETMSYQGVLRDASGTPVPDGDYSALFSLYDVETGGSPVWTEHLTVSVADGVFDVILGTMTPLLFPYYDQYWLGVTVAGEPELSPRTQLTSVPYAFLADRVDATIVSSVDGVENDQGNIDLVAGSNISIVPNDAANTITISATGAGDDGDWIISGGNVYRASGNVGIGTSGPDRRLTAHSPAGNEAAAHFTNDVTGSLATDGLVVGVSTGSEPFVMGYEENSGLVLGSGGYSTMRIYPTSAYISGDFAVYGTTFTDGFDMDTGASAGYVLTTDASGAGTWQPPAAVPDADWTISGSDVYHLGGKVGVGTSSPLADLHVNGDVFVPYSGAYAVGSTNYDGLSWDSGTGCVALGNSTTPIELLAGATYPPRMTVATSGDVGVGTGTATPEARLNVQTDTGDAMKAECTHTTSADYIAVIGRSTPQDYFGIGADFEGSWIGCEAFVSPTGNHTYLGAQFVASGGTGQNYGVYGGAEGSGTNYGVYGSVAGPGYAGYFSGNVYATGTITSGAVRSRIDHPLDPGNMYLNQNAVESDEMKTIYDGVVVLDADGSAWVEMPAWFEALNTELRYQLTCVGGYAPVYVAEEVRDNRFMIAGGTPGLKVSWQVTGVRNDAYAQTHRAPVEEMKPADERGLYAHPTALGFSEEASPDYQRQAEIGRKTAEARTDQASRASR
jgi:hypothetical protein